MAATEERLTYLEGQYGHLATKADVAAVEGALKADIAAVEGALKAGLAAVEGMLKADIAQLETRLIKWMIGLMVGSAALACSIAIVVLGLFR